MSCIGAGATGFEPVAFGFGVGERPRPPTFRNVPDHTSSRDATAAQEQQGTADDAPVHSACHAGATVGTVAAKRVQRPPLAISSTPPSRTEGTKATKADLPLLRALLPPALPDLLTPAQVTEKLAVCRATVYKLITAGQLAHIGVGALIRIPLSALAAYLSGERSNA